MTTNRPTDSESQKKLAYNAQYSKLNKLRKYLESAEFGQTISQIAEDLNLSRNTVKNYLEILRGEGAAYFREMGPAKIWFSQKKQETVPESRISGFLRAFLLETFSSFEALNPLPPGALRALFHEIGSHVGKKVTWPGETDWHGSVRDATNPRMSEIKQFVEQFVSIIEDTGIFLKAEIVPSVKDDNDAPILIRATFHKESWGRFKQYYNLMAGFFESKLRMVFGDSLYLAIREIQPEGQWCYYELGLTKNAGKGADTNGE